MQFSVSTTTGISTGSVNAAVRELNRGSQSAGELGDASPFADLFSNAVGQIDHLEDQARVAVDRMMTGSGVDVHQAMIATQKASMAFELALSVRNKAVQAYQSVIGMQF
jgi:flagellar hook-basal body complex protein FliE